LTLVRALRRARAALHWCCRLYAADKLPGGHVIMLGSHDSNAAAATAALAAYPGGLQIGGA